MAEFIGKIVVGDIPTKSVATENFNEAVSTTPGNSSYKFSVFDNGDSETFAYTIQNQDSADKPWIVCFQGNNCDASHPYMIENYKYIATNTGCNLLVCNHRTSPNSGDDMVQDAVDNIKKLKEKHPEAEVHLYGFSVGGSIAVQAAAKLKEEGKFDGKVIADRAFSNLKSWLEHAHKPKVPKLFDSLRSFSSFVTQRAGWKMDTAEAAKKLDENQLITIRIKANDDLERDTITPTDSSLGKSLEGTKHSDNEIVATSMNYNKNASFDHNTPLLYLTTDDEHAICSVIEKANLPTINKVMENRLLKMIDDIAEIESRMSQTIATGEVSTKAQTIETVVSSTSSTTKREETLSKVDKIRLSLKKPLTNLGVSFKGTISKALDSKGGRA